MNVVAIIAGALLNSLWQAAVLACAVWLALRILRRRVNAATRHLIWWSTLACVLLLPCVRWKKLAEPAESATPHRIVATASSISIPPPLAPPSERAPVTVIEDRAATWPAALLALWAVVCAWFLTGIFRGYLYLRAIKRRAAVCDRALPCTKRRVRLLVSEEITSPIAVGFWEPAVILPTKLRDELTASEMDHVLLHECAHLERGDDWENLAARLIGAAAALHPAAWWILRQIEHEREMACDEWAATQTGAARAYAESLVRLAELRRCSAQSVLATGICLRPSKLRRRIEALLAARTWRAPAAARIPVGVAAVVLACLAAAGALAPHWIAFAQRMQFEVASVKEAAPTGSSSVPGAFEFAPRISGTLVQWHNMHPGAWVYYAFHAANYQVAGMETLPDSVKWAWCNLDARAPEGATEDQVRLMFQSLLQDRFKLKFHRETREISEYELNLGKGKPKLVPANDSPTLSVTIENRTFPSKAGACSVTSWRDISCANHQAMK